MKSKSMMKKEADVKGLEKLVSGYSVIGILDMYKMPGRQLQKIRDKLKGHAVIKMNKKPLIEIALRNINKTGIEKLCEKKVHEPALILSNENPFALFKKLKENRSPAGAKIGDIALSDIYVKSGSTNQSPGPAISVFQKAGLKTTVKEGKIHVMSDKKIVSAGEAVSKDVVDVFTLLKMEPMEIGLDLVSVWENGTIYDKHVLDIDVKDYIRMIEKCVAGSVNISLNVNYPTDITIGLMLQKAFLECRTLGVGANIFEKSLIGDILAKSIAEEKSLEKIIEVKK